MTNRTLEESKIVAKFAPWNENDNSIWLATTLECIRNVEKFKFPGKLEAERKKQLLSLMSKEFLTSQRIEKPQVIKEEELSSRERNFLFEHFLIFENVHPDSSGNGAYIIDDSASFCALLNFKNHIQCYMLDIKGDLEKTWMALVAIEKDLEKAFNFAFSKKFGYLTAEPAACGTALIVTAFLHVPALIHTGKFTEVVATDKNEAMIIAGIQGDPGDMVGDIVTLRNRYTLGVNEETILASVRSSILHLVLNEKNARMNMQQSNYNEFKDKISKALGFLKYSYRLEVKEALNQLSLVKLGIELGYITGISIREINALFFLCKQSHLSYLSKARDALTSEELLSFRAEYIRSKIEQAEFM